MRMASTLPMIPQAREEFEPRTKLVGLSFAFILLIFANSIPTLIAASAFVIVPILRARILARWLFARLGILLLALLPFWLSVPFFTSAGLTLAEWGRWRITDAGVKAMAILLLRTTTITLWILYLLATTNWSDGVIAARRLGLPRMLSSILILTHRYLHMLNQELIRIRVAVRVRGFRNGMNRHSYRTIGQLIGSLFVRSYDRSEHLHQAMLMRGFKGDLPSLRKCQLRTRDWFFAAAAGLYHSALLVCEGSPR